MNIKKNIFINNTAASSGGALTILKQFIENIVINTTEYMFYVFCSIDTLEYDCSNLKIINNIKGKRWNERIYWDYKGLSEWSQQNNIKPDLIISLQNTGVFGFKNIPQIVYLHQSLPYYTELRWNFWDREERKLYIYKNLYIKFIDVSINNKDVVVQTKWMKSRVSKLHKINDDRIHVVSPSINNIRIEHIKGIENNDDNIIFYPAMLIKYKNHKVIIEAINLLKYKYNVNIVLVLTIDILSEKAKILREYIKCNNLEKNIRCIGKVDYETVLSFYKGCDLVVFPSYVETYGLPLIEAAKFNKPIIASDLEYAREVIGNYEGATFVDHKSPQLWAKEILKIIESKERKYIYIKDDRNNWSVFIKLIKKRLEDI